MRYNLLKSKFVVIENNNIENMALLYIGALDDTFPIMRYASEYKTFIYVDGLPNSNYFDKSCFGYEMFKNVECLVEVFIQNLHDSYESHEFSKDVENLFITQTKGGQEVLYFYNTLDKDVVNMQYLKGLLNKVTCLVIKGFSPVIDFDLPNLNKLYITDCCLEDYPKNFTNKQIDMDKLKVVHVVDTEFEDDIHEIAVICPECHEYIPVRSM